MASFTHKLLQIPVVQNCTSLLTKGYTRVKSTNVVTSYVSWTLESFVFLIIATVRPIFNKLQGPIDNADAFACLLLEVVKNKFPVILSSPEEVSNSASTSLINWKITQAVLYVIDRILFFIEKVIITVPGISVELDDGNDKIRNQANTATNTVLAPLKQAYSLATFPLKKAERLIYAQRSKIRNLQRPQVVVTKHPTRRRGVRKPPQPQGVVMRIFSFPVRVLNWIGLLAERRSRLKLHEDPDLSSGPVLRTRQVTPHEHDHEESDLNKLYDMEDYSSGEDPDYDPDDSDNSESLEYKSRSTLSEDTSAVSDLDASNISPMKNESPSPEGVISPGAPDGEHKDSSAES